MNTAVHERRWACLQCSDGSVLQVDVRKKLWHLLLITSFLCCPHFPPYVCWSSGVLAIVMLCDVQSAKYVEVCGVATLWPIAGVPLPPLTRDAVWDIYEFCSLRLLVLMLYSYCINLHGSIPINESESGLSLIYSFIYTFDCYTD